MAGRKEVTRVWPGPDYWSNPLQDWRISGGHLECIRSGRNRNVHVLTCQLADRKGGFRTEVTVGLPQWRQEFFYEHPCISNAERIPESEALVRKDWKYIYWPQQKVEQLFNLISDPNEENDLVNNPENIAVLSEMRARFGELKAEVQSGVVYQKAAKAKKK